MRVIVLTSSLAGFASACLPRLAEAGHVEVAMVVVARSSGRGRVGRLRRIGRKVRKIGLLGALNGVRMRRWFKRDVAAALGLRPVDALCAELGLRFEPTPRINCERTIALFQEADADLGLSLGNGYIRESVFSLPRHGMVNVHHELLPEFRGAQSVIWQIHEGSRRTGYTIHEIDRRIDAGRILMRRAMPIVFEPTLRRTVVSNYAELYRRSADGLVDLLTDFDDRVRRAQPQGDGRSFTTPSFRQYLRIVRNHWRMRRDAAPSA